MAAVIKALWKCDGEEAEIQNLDYSFNQNYDAIGQVSGEVMGGMINVSLMTAKSEKRFGWAITSDLKKDGEIEFIDNDGQTLKTLKFTDGYMVAYNESYSGFGGGGATENLTLSCRTIAIGGETHENTWETM